MSDSDDGSNDSFQGSEVCLSFSNDLVDSCENNLKLYLFADDAKMYCHIKDALHVDNLQRGINNFVKWTERWQVTLNINKCKVISVHHRRYTDSCLLYTSPSPRDRQKSRMPSSA